MIEYNHHGVVPDVRPFPSLAAITLGLFALAACGANSPVDRPADADAVTDLAVTQATDSSLTVSWTQVDDGTGGPAAYQVRYALPPIDWSSATIACDPAAPGDRIGQGMTCTIQRLQAETTYDVQLTSYRLAAGSWAGAVRSNITTAETAAPEPPPGGSYPPADPVTDLAVTETTDSSLTVGWTQVGDGAGGPAAYQVRYASPPIDWPSATVGCDATLAGDMVGAPMSCTIRNLSSGTSYDVQVASYRPASGTEEGAAYSNVATAATRAAPTLPAGDPEPVTDLAVTETTDSSLTVGWTQVGDGAGGPAAYQVRYASPPIDWPSATVGCDATLAGDMVGAPMSCTIRNLSSGTSYDVQVASYRPASGSGDGAAYSNVATGITTTLPAAEPPDTTGIWISPAELARLPMEGPAWRSLLAEANLSCGRPDLSDQEQNNNVCIMAKALVFGRTGETRYRTDVVRALRRIVEAPAYNGRALALGRELAAYVISADLIHLATFDPDLDASFRSTIRGLLTTYTRSGPRNLVECHERRPNNWGTHCGASRAAVAAYLGDSAQLARVAQVFRGWLGDRQSYSGFVDGDLSWQCDPTRPVGINPVGCTRNGHSIDGVLPDDQRRAGGFAWPPPRENYVWEALQGALVQAVILTRAGYPAFQWQDRALLRAARWLHEEAGYPASGDDGWQPWVLNHYYGTDFPAPLPAQPGKNVGWTDWIYGR